jgi:hypothetical protein
VFTAPSPGLSLTLVTLWALLAAEPGAGAEIPVWAGAVFRGTTVCGKPDPGAAALVSALQAAKLPETPSPEAVVTLAKAIAAHFEQKKAARALTGGCPPSVTTSALDPVLLVRLAEKNGPALDALEKAQARLAKLGEPGDELGRWAWALAQARGLNTPKGKALVKAGHAHFAGYVAKYTGADEDPSWRALAAATGNGLERFDRLGISRDSCSAGVEVTAQPASTSPQEKEVVTAVIALTNGCSKTVAPSAFNDGWARFFEGRAPRPVVAALAVLRACRARQQAGAFDPSEAETRAANDARAVVMKHLKVLFPRLRIRSIVDSAC